MDLAIIEAQKALKKNNVPVGCILVKNNEIIAKAHNQNFWHAEIICIDKAQKKIGKNLQNTILYVTLEPCTMCFYAAKLAKIHTIIYGVKKINNEIHETDKIALIKEEKIKSMLQDYFKKKR